jgi:hypothetical protein
MMVKAERKGTPSVDDSAVTAYENLNKFFRKFVKTTDQTSDYAHQFDTLTSGMRIYPNYRPDIGKLPKSIFYEDAWLGWQRMIFYG